MKIGRAILSLSILVAGSMHVNADTHTWTAGGGADTSWSTAANWGGTVPDPTDDVIFNLTGTRTVTIGTGVQTVNNISVVGSGAWTWSGSDSLNLTGTLSYSNSSAGGNFNALLAGAGSLRVDSGSLTLANVANTYSGGTTITGGKILLVGNSQTTLGTGVLTISGGTISRSGGSSATTTITNSVVLNGDVGLGGVQETIEFTGPITLTGDRTMNSISGGSTKISAGAAFSGNYTLRFTGLGTSLYRDNTGWNGAVIVELSNAGNYLFTVGSANAFGTNVTLRGGIIAPPNTTPVTIASGTAVVLDGNVRFGWSGGVNFNGPVTVTGNRTLTVSGGDSTFAGVLGSTNRWTITKSGGNSLYLSANNSSYTGDWSVVQGSMYFSTTNSAGGGQISAGTGAVVQLNAASDWSVRNDLAGGGTVKVGSGSADRIATLYGANATPGTSTNAGILTVQNAGGVSYNSHVVFTNSGVSLSALTIDVLGTNAVAGADYDQLHVVKGNISGLGNADLFVNVAPSLGKMNLSGKTLTVLTTDSGSLTGTFHSVQFTRSFRGAVNYNTNSVTINNLAYLMPGTVITLK